MEKSNKSSGYIDGTSGYVNKKFMHRNQKFVKLLKEAWYVMIYVLVLTIGMFIGYYYFVFQANRIQEESPIIDVKTLQETSIGFTERNELLLIERKSGRYTVYEDSVAFAIFTILANQKYNQVINP